MTRSDKPGDPSPLGRGTGGAAVAHPPAQDFGPRLGNGFAAVEESRPKLLDLPAPAVTLDRLARAALARTSRDFLSGKIPVDDRDPDEDGGDAVSARGRAAKGGQGDAKGGPADTKAEAKAPRANGVTLTTRVLELVRERGLTARIHQLSRQIKGTGLDDASRQLLSRPGVYEWLILYALEAEGVQDDDADGLRDTVLLGLRDRPRQVFAAHLIDEVVRENGVRLDPGLRAALVDRVRRANIPLGPGKAAKLVLDEFDTLRRRGALPAYVDRYLNKGEIDVGEVSAGVKNAMVRHLQELNLPTASPQFEQKFNSGQFDEYFIVAYNQATRAAAGGGDPLDLKFGSGTGEDWDFTVDTFDAIEDQGVVPENVRAAGALYYIYELGERMGVYRLADALVLRWGKGLVDFGNEETDRKVYKYSRRREDRSSPEDRDLLYRRALNLGEAEVLSGMVVNEDFPGLWHRLMEEVAEYIRRVEEAGFSEENRVSRSAVYEATRNLQYNLSDHMTGMAHMQTREMYAHLTDAMDLLGDDEVVDHFGGGRRRNVWQVIQRLSAEAFEESVNVGPVRTAAVEGNKVFQWVEKFDGTGTVAEEEFQAMVRSAEAWILAQSSGGGESVRDRGKAGEDDEADAGDDGEFRDDDGEFSDWDK